MISKRSLLPLFFLVSAVLGQGPDTNPELVAQLRLDATQVDRISLLKDSDFVFNFLGTAGLTMGAGGHSVGANVGTFPALVSQGLAMTVGFLGPCGLNTPHVHPRATEFNFAVNGTLRTGMLSENGARFVFNDVPPGSAALFPRGAIHFEQNEDCDPVLFVAAFSSEDPGNDAVAQRFFGLPPDIIQATLGSLGVQEIAELESKIPNNVALGTRDCLKRCGITNTTQPLTQRQPRNSGNALPSGFSGPAAEPPAAVPSVSFGTSGGSSNIKTNPVNAAASNNNNSGNSNSNSNNMPANNNLSSGVSTDDPQVRSLLIALLVINGVFVVGILTAVFMYVARKRGGPERMRDPSVPQFAPLHEERETEYYDPYHRPTSPPEKS